MSGVQDREVVLGLHACSRGIAFVHFEGPLSPIDWGIRDVKGKEKNAVAFEVAKQLIGRLQPDVIVVRAHTLAEISKSPRIHRLLKLIENFATGQAVEVAHRSKEDVRRCFAGIGATTRYEIAQFIASQIAEFDHRLPPRRKLWMPEDRRMSLFDAAALALAYYGQRGS